MMAILVGIDLGTTVLKACAFEQKTGRAVAQASCRLEPVVDNGGKRELDTAQVSRALKRAFAQIHADLGKRWGSIAGLGLAAQGGSCILADRSTGQARMPMILWNDMRFLPYCPEVEKGKKGVTTDFWRKLSWRDEPGAGLARILWLRATCPQLLKGDVIYAGAGDWLYYMLTGQWRQDAGNALQVGCYNVADGDLDAAPMALIGEELSLVSPMRKDHETHTLTPAGAKLLGLNPGIPIAGPYMDHEAGYLAGLGAAPAGARPLQFSLGTAWVGNFVLPAAVRWTSPFQLVLPSPAGSGYMVCQPLLTGNVTWDWAWKGLLEPGIKFSAIDRLFSESLFPPDGLCALPWLNRPNPLTPDALGGGSFFGVSATTTRQDLMRAMALAMVCEVRRVFQEVIAAGHVSVAILSGGASRGKHFQQFLSAALDSMPIRLMGEEDTAGPRGALYGLHKPIIRTRSTALPRASAKIQATFDRRYDQYIKLFDRLYAHLSVGGAVHFTRKP